MQVQHRVNNAIPGKGLCCTCLLLAADNWHSFVSNSCVVQRTSVGHTSVLGHLMIPKIPTSALQLFNYMLNHQENYPMRVLRMATASQDLDNKPLTSVSTSFFITKQFKNKI